MVYTVYMPMAGRIVVDVKADSEKEALEKALSLNLTMRISCNDENASFEFCEFDVYEEVDRYSFSSNNKAIIEAND